MSSWNRFPYSLRGGIYKSLFSSQILRFYCIKNPVHCKKRILVLRSTVFSFPVDSKNLNLKSFPVEQTQTGFLMREKWRGVFARISNERNCSKVISKMGSRADRPFLRENKANKVCDYEQRSSATADWCVSPTVVCVYALPAVCISLRRRSLSNGRSFLSHTDCSRRCSLRGGRGQGARAGAPPAVVRAHR